jgi:broad specificity phosphatase PhoE
MRLVLCRHADAGDPEGAPRLASVLAELAAVTVYTSPLARAVETARAVGERHGLSPVIREDLREIELGELEGLQFEQYPVELQEALLTAPGTVQFPNGESYAALRGRVVGAFAEIVALHTGGTVVAISHAGAIRASLAAWLEVPPDASFRIEQRLACVNVVDWTDGIPFVRLVNGTALP